MTLSVELTPPPFDPELGAALPAIHEMMPAVLTAELIPAMRAGIGQRPGPVCGFCSELVGNCPTRGIGVCRDPARAGNGEALQSDAVVVHVASVQPHVLAPRLLPGRKCELVRVSWKMPDSVERRCGTVRYDPRGGGALPRRDPRVELQPGGTKLQVIRLATAAYPVDPVRDPLHRASLNPARQCRPGQACRLLRYRSQVNAPSDGVRLPQPESRRMTNRNARTEVQAFSKGGAEGTRTPDPHTASVVRYQLRHSPLPAPGTSRALTE